MPTPKYIDSANWNLLADGEVADADDVALPLSDLDQALDDFVNGVAPMPSPDIDGGTIDAAAIGGTTPSTATFTAVTVDAATNQPLNIQRESDFNMVASSANNVSTGTARLQFYRARGTLNTPQAVDAYHQIGQIQFYSHDGQGYSETARLQVNSIENSHTASNHGTQFRVNVTPSGSTTLESALVVTDFGILPGRDEAEDLGASYLRYRDAYVVNGVTTGSDGGTKEDVQDLRNNVARNMLQRIRPRTFRRKNDQKRTTHFGLVAQEVKQVFQDMGLNAADYGVVVEPDEAQGGTLGIRYGQLIPVLIRAMQEQERELQELRARLDAIG